MKNEHKGTERWAAAGAVMLAAVALALLALSFLPLAGLLLRLTAAGSGAGMPPVFEELPALLPARLRLAALVLLGAAALAYRFKQAAAAYAAQLRADCRPFMQELARFLAGVVRDRVFLGALILIMLLAVAFRWYYLFQPVRYDEACTFLYFASRPLPYGLSYYGSPNNHLLHTLLVHCGYRLLGSDPWVLRLPALLAGILMVPAAFLAARLYYNRYAALLAAALVASSSYLIMYSTLARGYTMLCLFFLVLLGLAAYLKESDNRCAWFLFALTAALGLYTVPVMVYPLGAVLLWLLAAMAARRSLPYFKRRVKHLACSTGLAGAFTGALYLPVLLVSGGRAITANEIVLPLTWTQFVVEFFNTLWSALGHWHHDLPAPVVLLLAAGAALALLFHRRLASPGAPFLAWPALAFFLPALLIQQVVPFVRVWIFLLVLYFILASAGLSLPCLRPGRPEARGLRAILFPLLAVGLALGLGFSAVNADTIDYSYEIGTLREAEPIALFLKENLQPGDRVLAATPSNTPLEYYFLLHGIPAGYLGAPPPGEWRVIVVVNESFADTPAHVLALADIPPMCVWELRVLQVFESAILYEAYIY